MKILLNANQIRDKANLSSRVNYSEIKEDEDGEYYAKFIAIRPLYFEGKTDTEEDYMDIAFMAACDTLESAESLISGNSYEYYTTGRIGKVITITE